MFSPSVIPMFIVHLGKFQIRLIKLFILPLQRVSLLSILLLVFLACQVDDELTVDQGISPEKEKPLPD